MSRRLDISVKCVCACILLAGLASCTGGSSSPVGGGSGPEGPPPAYDGDRYPVVANPPSPYTIPVSYTWGQVRDAGQSWMDACAAKIKHCSTGLYRATEGYMWFDDQALDDKASTANILIENLWQDYLDGTTNCGICYWSSYGSDMYYYILLAGTWEIDIFLHEFCHGQFNKHGEEYSCSICVMGTYMRGRSSQLRHFCDSGDCQVSGPARDCWGNFITQAYTNWNHPGRDPGGNPPTCNVTITNN